MEVGALLLPPAMVAEALTPAAVALLRESPVQLSIEARTEPGAPAPLHPAFDLKRARRSVSRWRPGSSAATGCRRGVRQQAGRDVRGSGAGRGAGRGRPRARRAVGRLRLGRRAHAAGSPRAPALRLPWRVRTVIYNHQPRARCAAAQVRNRADAGCSVEASLACHAASVPPGVERPLLDADVLASGVLSGTSRVAGRAWCVWGPPA